MDCPTDAGMTGWQLGHLVGGDEGRARVAESEAWMRAQGVRDVVRFVATLAPPVSSP
jgi:hypothetical protein